MKDVNKEKQPRHVAIIMDGNGRWAQQRGMPRLEGHKKGMETVRSIVKQSMKRGVSYLTLYAFSMANWNRPKEEVTGLFGILRRYFNDDVKKLHEQGVRLRMIGNRRKFPEDVLQLIEAGEELTKNNTAMTLLVALSYDGRDEIVEAAASFARDVQASDRKPEDLTEDSFAKYLYTAGVPDPDLVIRTSGEMRISGFLLWQLAYAEIYVTDTYWPDFSPEDFDKALTSFGKRERRFGALSTESS